MTSFLSDKIHTYRYSPKTLGDDSERGPLVNATNKFRLHDDLVAEDDTCSYTPTVCFA